ncbi:uncharacterized protein [Notamacropus eugenii]|uniref:uncharacterized protein n=1 Tax=Notamacropus eugenii TaxID=9315 RepID=UPI003B671C90
MASEPARPLRRARSDRAPARRARASAPGARARGAGRRRPRRKRRLRRRTRAAGSQGVAASGRGDGASWRRGVGAGRRASWHGGVGAGRRAAGRGGGGAGRRASRCPSITASGRGDGASGRRGISASGRGVAASRRPDARRHAHLGLPPEVGPRHAPPPFLPPTARTLAISGRESESQTRDGQAECGEEGGPLQGRGLRRVRAPLTRPLRNAALSMRTCLHCCVHVLVIMRLHESTPSGPGGRGQSPAS